MLELYYATILAWLTRNAPIFQALGGIVAMVGIPAAILAFFRQRGKLREIARRQKLQHYPDKLKFQIHVEFQEENASIVRLGINDLSLPLDIRTLLLSEEVAWAMEAEMLRAAAPGDSTLLRLPTVDLQTRMYEELAGIAGTYLPQGAASHSICIHGERGHDIKRRIIRIVFYTDNEVDRYSQPQGTDHLQAEKPHQFGRIRAVIEACTWIAKGFTDAVVRDDKGFIVAHRVRDPRGSFEIRL